MGDSISSTFADKTDRIAVDTFAGKVHVEWDPTAAVTPLGQLAFFIDFLKTGGVYEPWVADCPLHYTSPNAPEKRDLLGTVLLSVLAGHHRYSHMTNVRSDNVNPALLGMTKVVSEDAVRRGFKQIDEHVGVSWLTEHMRRCYESLLCLPWIMDGDTTVKPLYGKQEGAVIGYNPHKPGRPSHTYHSYLMANTRLVLDVEVQAGNKTATCYSTPGLWQLLDRIPRSCWPAFFRGDSGSIGSDFGIDIHSSFARQTTCSLVSIIDMPLILQQNLQNNHTCVSSFTVSLIGSIQNPLTPADEYV